MTSAAPRPAVAAPTSFHPFPRRQPAGQRHRAVHCLSAACASVAPMNPKQVSVQMFQWNWDDIATECTQWLGPKGFGAVQISPPGASKVGQTAGGRCTSR